MEPTTDTKKNAEHQPYRPTRITENMPEGFFMVQLFFEKLQVVETKNGFVVERIAMLNDEPEFEVIGTVSGETINALLESDLMDRDAYQFLKAHTIQ
jgi:hypothetical protein